VIFELNRSEAELLVELLASQKDALAIDLDRELRRSFGMCDRTETNPPAAPAPQESTMEEQIEQEIQAKGLTAPRVTPADIEAEIAGEYTFTAADATQGCPQFQSLAQLTFCVLVLRNGFTVTGESACASPENFDAEIGRKIARQNAVAKIWPLLGFRLRDKLANGEVTS
jgi:hypothetical protein